MIAVHQLAAKIGDFALHDISFEVPAGRYGVLMGKTGSGKTTILECICGLRSVLSGIIRLHGRDVTHLKPGERGIGYVPQDAALFTTMTVREHLTLAPTIRRWKPSVIEEQVTTLAELLGINRLLDRKPEGLSGGEIQRVALGRALAHRPDILCLDEPLIALDDQTHEEMCALLKSVQHRTGVTVLHITHSRRELDRLADHLFVIENGILNHLQTDNQNEL